MIVFARVSSGTRSENVLRCGLYIFDARLYIRVSPPVLIVNIARGLCLLDVGPSLIRKPKENRKALSVPFPSTFGNRGPKMEHKGRMALSPVFSHMLGKADSILQSTVEGWSKTKPEGQEFMAIVYGPARDSGTSK